MFELLGSLIGVILVFGIGVYTGKNHYDKLERLIETIKTLFKKN